MLQLIMCGLISFEGKEASYCIVTVRNTCTHEISLLRHIKLYRRSSSVFGNLDNVKVRIHASCICNIESNCEAVD